MNQFSGLRADLEAATIATEAALKAKEKAWTAYSQAKSCLNGQDFNNLEVEWDEARESYSLAEAHRQKLCRDIVAIEEGLKASPR